jgi:hypothetical protein
MKYKHRFIILLIGYSKIFYKTLSFKNCLSPYQLLVGLVVIGAEFDGKYHYLIPRNCDRERVETT